ncbi:MAG: hypothetical protein P8011_11185 [Acidihalobacter sp.]|uniref:hypothetical protein n=1 Tax=Acidihalobacter sp. TaxID=1872108 RepID=UPI00307FAF4F
MSLLWVIFGSLVQLTLAAMFFMLVVFSSAGIANCRTLTHMQSKVLDWSIYALPLSCVLSAVLMIILYWNGSSAIAYWWYALPAVAITAYLIFALMLNAGAPRTTS